MSEAVFAFLLTLQRETLIFASVGLTLGGLDDLLVDLLYFIRRGWRALFVYSRHSRMTTATLPTSPLPGRIAVFIPAWQEAAVIGAMLTHALRCWGHADFRIFVGTYPNDRDTVEAIAAVAEGQHRIIMAINDRHGPTTKADCLNILWRAMLREEGTSGIRFKAIVLHDAEDVVHADEIALFDYMIDRCALVQLPVLPLPGHGTWLARAISNHYADEFAESHSKALIVREALGASIPSAGVACAFARDILAGLASRAADGPFDPGSLTEDYEVGLRIADQGGKGMFVRMRDRKGALVATQEYFPDTMTGAVRQKARWTIGISLAGWDRLGWRGGPAEWWMRVRDRRAALAAFILFSAYLSLVLWAVLALAHLFLPMTPPAISGPLEMLLWLNFALMSWRTAMRALFSASIYGWRHGLGAIPRTFIANLIAILAARRAVFHYCRSLLGMPLIWDKTVHRFPDMRPDP